MAIYITGPWKGIRFKLSSLRKGILRRKIYCCENNSTVFNIVSRGKCELVLKTDAYITGWGAVLNYIFAKGLFKSEGSNSHTNLFAPRINKQLSWFFSFRADPEAEMINAFSMSWPSILCYCVTPFVCIGNVIQKLILDKSSGSLAVPDNWLNRCWYSTLSVLFIEPGTHQLYFPNQPETTHLVHLVFRHIQLMAWKMCRKCFENSTYPKI